MKKPTTRAKLRDELKKLMPRYKWTVHRPNPYNDYPDEIIIATGIRSSGFNRMSTIKVVRRETKNGPWYTARSAGYGTKAGWAGEEDAETLAKAMRLLQNHYEGLARFYSGLATELMDGRKPPKD